MQSGELVMVIKIFRAYVNSGLPIKDGDHIFSIIASDTNVAFAAPQEVIDRFGLTQERIEMAKNLYIGSDVELPSTPTDWATLASTNMSWISVIPFDASEPYQTIEQAVIDETSGAQGALEILENLLKPLFDGSEFLDANTVKPYEPPQPTAEILKTFELFKEQIELIHNGKLPIWTEFFALVKQLDDEYFSSHGESTSLADELFSVYELDNNEAIYSDDNFMTEILKILSDNIHLLCFLRNSGYENEISKDMLIKMCETVLDDHELMTCYECGMNRWWGNPVAYLAFQENLPQKKLVELFQLTIALPKENEMTKDIILCSLASNKSTPLDVLKKLQNEERYALMAADEQCPFWDETDKETSNIAELARRTILKNGSA